MADAACCSREPEDVINSGYLRMRDGSDVVRLTHYSWFSLNRYPLVHQNVLHFDLLRVM